MCIRDRYNGVIPVPRRQFLQNRAVLCLERFVTRRRVMHAFPKTVVLRVSGRQKQRRRVKVRDRAGLANAVIVTPDVYKRQVSDIMAITATLKPATAKEAMVLQV